MALMTNKCVDVIYVRNNTSQNLIENVRLEGITFMKLFLLKALKHMYIYFEI